MTTSVAALHEAVAVAGDTAVLVTTLTAPAPPPETAFAHTLLWQDSYQLAEQDPDCSEPPARMPPREADTCTVPSPEE